MSSDTLVPIKPGGSRAPLYGVPGIWGNMMLHRNLMAYLHPEQPFYGIQTQGLDGKQPPFTMIEEMASHYVKAIRAFQPTGPYHLWGFSFGGFVAFEMARQLYAEGAQVGLFAVIDTGLPFLTRYELQPSLLRRVVYTIIGLIDLQQYELARRGTRQYLQTQKQSLKDRLKRMLPAVADKLYPNEQAGLSPLVRKIEAANMQAWQDYIPRLRQLPPYSYPGRITLFAAARTFLAWPDMRLGWSELTAGGLEVHLVPGDHLTMREEPHIKVLAERLSACLERAQAVETTRQP